MNWRPTLVVHVLARPSNCVNFHALLILTYDMTYVHPALKYGIQLHTKHMHNWC